MKKSTPDNASGKQEQLEICKLKLKYYEDYIQMANLCRKSLPGSPNYPFEFFYKLFNRSLHASYGSF